MKYLVIAAATIAFTTGGIAVAAPHEGSAFIKDYDANNDGQVTLSEFGAGRTARFAVTDADHDGTVSEQEYVAEYSARLESQLAASDLTESLKTEDRQRQMRQAHVRFGVLDHDKDGKMQKAEYDVSGARAFAGQDHDKNTIITAADVAATSARQTAERAK